MVSAVLFTALLEYPGWGLPQWLPEPDRRRFLIALANGSDQVGRNLMKHLTTAIAALSIRRNPAVYQKTIAVADWY